MQSVITYSCFSYSACTTSKMSMWLWESDFPSLDAVTDGVEEATLSRHVSTSHLSLFNGEVVHIAAQYIQRVVRGVLVRKRLRLAVSLRKASTTVQAWWRGILIRVPESVRYAQIRRRQLAGVSASKEIVALARIVKKLEMEMQEKEWKRQILEVRWMADVSIITLI